MNAVAGMFGLCIFMKFTSMKNGLPPFGVRFNIFDRRVSLSDIEFMQVVVVDARNLGRGFAGDAFPFVEVDDLLILLPVLRVIFREPRMRDAVRVVVGVDTRIVGGELLHFIEAVLDRIELRLIA